MQHQTIERDMLLLVAAGNRQAFNSLLHARWNKVYTLALTYLRSAEDAQELTQDVFLKVWQNRTQLPSVVNFDGWLFILARNGILSELRKKKARPIISAEPGEWEEDTILPDHPLIYKEASALVAKGIEALPPARKKVFTLSRMEGKSYEEIAAMLNISRNGVKDHIVKALHFLRNYLHEHGGDGLMVILLFAGMFGRK
ncbi:RNA polymerase sigma-70 factor [Chitinophaga sp. 22620]|uniref:RNA polymerase sigma-70 factor n=1 Tax=Chitinophaga sp. 22620 TaxID=3453952 RepID=UPI003F82B555